MSLLRILPVSEAVSVVRTPVAASQAVGVGDVMLFDGTTNHVGYSAANLNTSGLTTLALMQAAVKAAFLGIALEQRIASYDRAGSIGVATSCRANAPCYADSTARDIGTMYGANGTLANAVYTPLNQQLIVVTDPKLCIAKLVKEKAAGDTMIEVKFVGTIVAGGFAATVS